MTYESTVLADSPSLLWMLDETSGTAAADATGNGNAGTYSGGFTLGAAGPSGVSANAVTLDGSTGFVYENTAQAVSGALTHEIWIRTTGTGFPATGGSSSQGASGTYDRELFVQGTSGDPAWYIYGIAAISGTAAVNDGNWHHLVGTYDGSVTNLYVDGALAAGPSASFTDTGYTAYWMAGRSGGTGGSGLTVSSAFFSGDLCAFSVYNVALSASQVLAHYNAASGTGANVTGAAAAVAAAGGTGTPAGGAGVSGAGAPFAAAAGTGVPSAGGAANVAGVAAAVAAAAGTGTTAGGADVTGTAGTSAAAGGTGTPASGAAVAGTAAAVTVAGGTGTLSAAAHTVLFALGRPRLPWTLGRARLPWTLGRARLPWTLGRARN